MGTKIEELLLKKTENSASRIFFTQWQVAKDYIPQVLSTISQVFPHYSLHDKSHSEAIINNIIRIIGFETLEKLSAIDLWLIISVAYYHDIGMAVFASAKDAVFNNKDFLCFIKKIQAEENSPLYEYGICFEIREEKIYYVANELTSKNYDSAKFLLAEFIRQKHADRAIDIIEEESSINLAGSPIPKRIIQILSRICAVHCQSFSQVMELPITEVGIDTDDCHPRYIACLLRLGDLLDMDSNRFSEILLKTLKTIPIDSIQHKEKDLSITHIRIDRIKIEATAVCNSYEVADLTNRWFSYIDDEIYDQTKNWNDIVPETSYGFLPTVGELKVSLKDYDTFDGKTRPSFSVDPQKIIELLQGTGLYKEPYQSIRELLQNATDATLLRIFAERQEDGSTLEKKDLQNYCKDYPINITLESKIVCDEKIIWTVTICDNGIGMSKTDLSYLTTTGKSSKNTEKLNLIKQMPEWMKPSGTFGIGFQSVFLLTDVVEITTRKIHQEYSLDVSLNNPAGKNEGAIFFKTNTQCKQKYGTKVSFNLECEKVPNNWSVNLNQEETRDIMKTYDFVEDPSLDIATGKVIDEVRHFAFTSYIPITLKINNEEIKKSETLKSKLFDYEVEDENIELSIFLNQYSNTLYYRNQFISESNLDFIFLAFHVNILSGNAKDILTLNRNQIQSSYRAKLREKIINSAIQVLSECGSEVKEEIKPWLSMFVLYYASEDAKKQVDQKRLSYWETFEVGTEHCKKTLKEVVSFEKIILRFHEKIDYDFSLKINGNTIIIDSYILSSDISKFIIYINQDYYISFNEDENAYYDIFEITLSKAEIDLIDDWEWWFRKYKQSLQYARTLMPCNKKYIALALKDDYKDSVVRDNIFVEKKKYPQMICPYIRIYNRESSSIHSFASNLEWSASEKLFNIAFENRLDETVTIEDIRKAYAKFKEDMEKIVEKVNQPTKPSALM
ncbi:MAG: HD domain-containing protein [Treponemataceae bacterium]